MSTAKDILRLIPMIESAKLASKAAKSKKPVKSAVDTIFGTSFIQAESDLIEGMS